MKMHLLDEIFTRGRGSVIQGREQRVSVQRDRTGTGARQSLERQTEWNDTVAEVEKIAHLLLQKL